MLEVKRLLAMTRLLTLTGTGGCGTIAAGTPCPGGTCANDTGRCAPGGGQAANTSCCADGDCARPQGVPQPAAAPRPSPLDRVEQLIQRGAAAEAEFRLDPA